MKRIRIRETWAVLRGRAVVERRTMIVLKSVTEVGARRWVLVMNISLRGVGMMADCGHEAAFAAPCGEYYRVMVQ